MKDMSENEMNRSMIEKGHVRVSTDCIKDAVEQMRIIMIKLKDIIESINGCNIKDSCFIHLYMSDIHLFGAVNKEYCLWFGRNPPSR
jgi:hypothetical protein